MMPPNRKIPRASRKDPSAGEPTSRNRPEQLARGEEPKTASTWVGVIRAVAGCALVVGLSGTVAWAVRRHILTSPRFLVTDISVVGSHQLSAEAILAEAGLSKGQNIFTVDLDRARAKILADPWISDATLGRRLPGNLTVQVTERELGAVVVLRQPYLASQKGVIFKRFELGDPTDVPLITGIDPDAVADDRVGVQAVVRRALDLANDFVHSPLGQKNRLQEVHVTKDGGFTLVAGKEGMSFVFGSPPFRRKLEQAVRVVAELDRRGARPESIMLDDEARPERVVVRTR
jgi:cell division protein FtsQ